MPYLTYSEYLELGGPDTIEDEVFDQFEFRARKRIDYLTDSRVAAMAEVPEAVKRAMVEVIRNDIQFGSESQKDNALITSFSTDGYSENYGSVSEQTNRAEKELLRSVRDLLYGEKDDRGVPLLYRGVYA